MKWHQSYQPFVRQQYKKRTLEAIAARNRAAVALREKLPGARDIGKMMNRSGEYVEEK